MGRIKTYGGMVVACAGLVCSAMAADATSAKPLPPGTVAPTFSLPTLSGARQTLSVWCGKTLSKPYLNNTKHTVVLSFWATYCKPCQKEIPELMKFAEANKDEDIKIFCISLDKEGAKIVAPFVKEKGYTLPVLLDPYKRTAQRYGVKTLPALVVVGPNGVVRYSSVGYKEGVPFGDILQRAVTAAQMCKNMSPQGGGEGESVAVIQDTDPASQVPPRKRWRAVARVECGEPIEKVARDVGVPPETIKEWYTELKESAIDMWGGEEQ